MIGGEYYVVQNSRNFEVAQAFVAMVERFKTYAGRFGYSAEGNPSGGNNFRGLYNIVIKSLGAAKKRSPETRLEHVVDYSERLYPSFVGAGTEEAPEFPNGRRGFCFMDSPGNDMESIAGEVAGGCNVVCFTTGNGSITNFPFVPTIKVLTTTGRFQILENDIDVNAGLYLDGEFSLEEMGIQVFEQMVRVASGELSVGERCGHHQVQIWRDWPGQSCCADEEETLKGAVIADDWREERPDLEHDGRPIQLKLQTTRTELSKRTFQALINTNDLGEEEVATDGIGLLLPTSLCSGQCGVLMAGRLNKKFVINALAPTVDSASIEPEPEAGDSVPSALFVKPFSRIVAIPHTEVQIALVVLDPTVEAWYNAEQLIFGLCRDAAVPVATLRRSRTALSCTTCSTRMSAMPSCW